MNPCKWHWARLKKDMKISPSSFFANSFIIPEGTAVRTRFYTSSQEKPIIELVVGDLIMTTHGTQYSDLLEPLE